MTAYGHDIGDEVLKEFASRIAANVRGIDLACRYGGEEFVVVMPDTDMAFAYAVPSGCASRSRPRRSRSAARRSTLNITISIGIAGCGRRRRHRRCAAAPRRPGALSGQETGRNKVVADAA